MCEDATRGSQTEIALSLGPYGACMVPSQEYSGAYDAEHSSVDQLQAWHLQRLRLFMEQNDLLTRIGYIAFETIPRADEIIAIRRAVEESGIVSGSQAPKVWISCVFPNENALLPDGSTIPSIFENLTSKERSSFVPWGIGINCTKIDKLQVLVNELEENIPPSASRGLSLVLYPDGTNGEVYNTTTQMWELPPGPRPERRSWETQLADIVRQVDLRGNWASIVVGGCCKATPEDIRRLRHAISNPRDF